MGGSRRDEHRNQHGEHALSARAVPVEDRRFAAGKERVEEVPYGVRAFRRIQVEPGLSLHFLVLKEDVQVIEDLGPRGCRICRFEILGERRPGPGRRQIDDAGARDPIPGGLRNDAKDGRQAAVGVDPRGTDVNPYAELRRPVPIGSRGALKDRALFR